MKSKRIVIQDANVLMDMINGGILETWFLMGVETVTTDFVVAEIKHPEQFPSLVRAIQNRQIRVSEIAPEVMAEEYTLMVELQETWGISIPDASVLRAAQTEKAALMSGDRRLRKAATTLGIESKGVLWALDELVLGRHLTCHAAANALAKILDSGGRLPRGECVERLDRWRSISFEQ